jgi:hypothetical protein
MEAFTMSNLSSEARRVIALARRADDPIAADQRRVGLGLAKQLGAGATAMAVSVGTAKTATGAAVVTTLGKSVIFIAFSAAVALSLGQPSSRAADTSSNGARAAHESASAANVANRVKSSAFLESTADAIAAKSIPSREEALPPPGLGVQRTMPAKEVGESAANVTGRRAATAKFEPLPDLATAATDPNVDPLQAETAALREAQRALRVGDPATAISLTLKQDAIFQAGALGQERAAVRIFALCATGNASKARSEANDFIRRWPRSPMLSRVRSACDIP